MRSTEERLHERGLTEAVGESASCRWRHPGTGLALYVMPVAVDVLGFSNPWHPLGIDTAVGRVLPYLGVTVPSPVGGYHDGLFFGPLRLAASLVSGARPRGRDGTAHPSGSFARDSCC